MEFSGMYEFVRCEVLELNARWIVFKQLFAQGEARVSLLNREVPALFSMFHDAVRDGILMSIARLTDKPKVGRKDTLSLRQLIEHRDLVCDDAIATSLPEQLEKIEKEQRNAIRSWRDSSGAHNDLLTVLNPQVHPLPPIMFDSIGNVLRQMADLLNTIALFLGQHPTDFESIIMLGDGETIISCLESAKEHRLCRSRKPPA